MGEVVWVSLLGMLVFGGLFLLLCPEWWSTSLGTLKEKQKGQEAKAPEVEQPGGRAPGGLTASERAPAERR